jgi:hypothetical protein
MNKLFLFFCIFLFTSSCKKDFKVTTACTDLVDSEVRLPLGYLGSCAWGAEPGDQKNMKVTITVDGVTVNEQGQTVNLTYMNTYTFNKTNIHDGGTAPESVFPIKIPRCGTFVVTVNVRGKDDTCFTCCNGASTFMPNCGSSSTSKGVPHFRGTSVQINSDSQNPPPSVLEIDVKPTTCEDCGC